MYSVKELEQVIRRLHEMRVGLDPEYMENFSIKTSLWYLRDALDLAAIEAAILQLELVKTQKILAE